MNFVFVSPHFPKSYWNFCDRLKRNGVNVLGIGDAPYDEIPEELKRTPDRVLPGQQSGRPRRDGPCGGVFYLPLRQD